MIKIICTCNQETMTLPQSQQDMYNKWPKFMLHNSLNFSFHPDKIRFFLAKLERNTKYHPFNISTKELSELT